MQVIIELPTRNSGVHRRGRRYPVYLDDLIHTLGLHQHHVAFARAESATISRRIGNGPKVTVVVQSDREYCLELIDIGRMWAGHDPRTLEEMPATRGEWNRSWLASTAPCASARSMASVTVSICVIQSRARAGGMFWP